MPPLSAFDTSKHSMLTDNKRQLYLSDIADLPVGHVPKELAPVFWMVLDTGGSIHAEVCGEPVPSSFPWPEQHEEGGGVVIPCNYILEPAATCFDGTVKCLKDTLSKMAADNSMDVMLS